MYLVPRYVYVGKCIRAASPKKQRTEGLLMKLLQKTKRCTWSQDTYMSVLRYQGYIPPQKNNRRPIHEIASTCGAPRNHTNVQPVDAHV